MPYWIEYTNKAGLVRLKCNERNNFSDRKCVVRLTNKTNINQYIDLNLTQKEYVKD